ncbi:hypothetical protein TSUD_215190 [Trifolium subterraneum]|uniref:Uncharacterized protein n=1 Tax=Trifolium subterraneum TaxID=3900 RepID=A0A2Z6MI51_TRISU|nr:hypothetical protein TSUD_215190 [Trifolium subterraneum]
MPFLPIQQVLSSNHNVHAKIHIWNGTTEEVKKIMTTLNEAKVPREDAVESPSSFSHCIRPTRLVREIPYASFRLHASHGADQPRLLLL